jgi:hypothetical protein
MQTVVTDAPVDPMLQIAGLLPPEAKATTRRRREGDVREVTAPVIGQQEGGTAAVSAPAGTEGREGLGFLDREIERLESELQTEQEEYQRGLQSVDYDLLNRSRRAFEQEVGVIGQGGGPFGLAPRPRRTLPRVDQPLAQERIDAFEEAALADRERRQDLVQKRRQLLLRREDALAVEGEMSGALLMSINKELDDVTAQLEQPSLVERALQSEDFTPRRAGELLLRDRPLAQRGGGEPVVPQGRVTAGEATIEEAPVVPPDVRDTYKGEPPVDIQVLTEEERIEAAPPPMGEKPEGVLPEAPVIEPPAPTGGIPTAPAPIDFGTPGREMPAQTLDEAQAIAQPDILRRDDYVPSDSLIQDAIAYYKGMTITRGNEPTITIRNPVRHFGNETELAINYLQDRIRDNAPVLQDVSEEIEGVREEREPEVQEEPRRGIFRRRSTRQRKDAYKMKVVSEGTKLASQPKRLQRIAKTESEPEDRPQHLVIVDRLYDTNKGKADAFKMTYDEISRAFAEKPDERKEAHTYLVAKDILESNIEEPLA